MFRAKHKEFRGQLAAASLKLRVLAGNGPVCQQFRGQLAAASLKLRYRLRFRGRREQFRGQLAAASLKRPAPSGVHIFGRKFRGQLRRGLVEAMSRIAAPMSADGNSAASWPRPH